MFVYGIRCAPADLPYLPDCANADYYLDYGLLVFPHYTRPGFLRNTGGRTGARFWSAIKLLVENPARAHAVASPAEGGPDHPSLSKGELEVLAEIRRAFPATVMAWYHVPHVASAAAAAPTQQPDESEEDC